LKNLIIDTYKTISLIFTCPVVIYRHRQQVAINKIPAFKSKVSPRNALTLNASVFHVLLRCSSSYDTQSSKTEPIVPIQRALPKQIAVSNPRLDVILMRWS